MHPLYIAINRKLNISSTNGDAKVLLSKDDKVVDVDVQ